LLAQDTDPSAAKREKKQALAVAEANTVEAIGRAWLANHKDGWGNEHYIREQRNLEKNVFPYIGKRAIGTVEPPELLRVIRKVEAAPMDYACLPASCSRPSQSLIPTGPPIRVKHDRRTLTTSVPDQRLACAAVSLLSAHADA